MGAPTATAATRRARTPTVLQMEAVECGAAALSMVLGYYGRIVSLEELRVACGVSRDGTKASNILKAARTYGLKGKGFSKQPKELRDFPAPMVLFWNFNHFVVLEGFGKGKVYLNDPATGPRTVTDEEFASSFTGVVLVFETGPEFKPGGAKRGFFGPLRRRLAGSGSGLVYVLLVSLLLSLMGLVVPLFTRVFVDNILIAKMSGWVGPLLIGMAIIAIARAALTWMQLSSLLRLETKLSLTSSYQFFRHVLRLPIEFFTQRYGGEVGGRVEINDRIARLLSRDLATNILNATMAVLYLAFMLSMSGVLTLVGLVVVALNFFALQAVARYRRDTNMRLLQERAKLLGTAMSGLQAIETLKATGSESDFFARWSGQLAKVLTTEQRMSVSTLMLGSLPVFLSAMDTAVILGVGSWLIMAEPPQLTPGMLVAFQGLMFGFLDPVNQLVGLGSTLQEVEGEMNRLDDVMRYPLDPNVVAGRPLLSITSPRLSGSLQMKGIVYGHSRLEPPLIQGFEVRMAPGSRVALVGPSGSGKTTLAKIISGIHRPWEGEVLFDDMPATQIPREVLTNSVAVVDQEFFLFEGSVREVLTMWDSTVPEEAIIQAAKDACIHDEIAARPGGYDSKVEEGGANFSGGQRQRLEIARALVNNPSILVLDEATSALDTVTEGRIDENLRRRGCTCVIVAHRLSTIRDCDEIIVLDRGQIVQRGPHERLAAEAGTYRELLES